MFYTNAYPADKDANKGLVTSIKFLSMAIIASEATIIYTLVSNIYDYIVTVHRQPDLLMLICTAFVFLSGLKITCSLFGYHLS